MITKKIGKVENRSASKLIPRVILGDRHFLRRYGSVYSITEIQTLYDFAGSMGFGLAYSDEVTANASMLARAEYYSFTIQHFSDLITDAVGRCGATIAHILKDKHKKRSQAALEYYLLFNKIGPFTSREISEISISDSILNRELTYLTDYKPDLITIGGDWIDLLLILKKDLILVDVVKRIRDVTPNLKIAFFSYLYFTLETPQLLEMIRPDYIFMPANAVGFNMFPSRENTLKKAELINIPAIACHPMALGKSSMTETSDFLSENPCIISAIFGARNREQIEALVKLS